MRRLCGSWLILVAVAAGGCAQTQAHRDAHGPLQVRQPRYFVPTAAIIQSPDVALTGSAGQVLPESDSFVNFQRGEKVAWGDFPVYGFSAISVYTYDTQRISSPRDGGGYRYRWGVETRVTAP